MGDNSLNASREEMLHEQIANATKMRDRNPVEAMALAETTLRVAEAEGYPRIYARALRVHAACQQALGNLQASCIELQAALEQAEILEDTLLQAQCLQGLGNVHCTKGEFARALECIHRSIALRRSIEDEHGLMVAFNTLGAYLAEMGDYADAVVRFTDALQLARRRGDRVYEALTLSNIGNAKLEFGEYEQAITYLVESIGFMHETGSRLFEPHALENLAIAHYRLGRLEEALELGGKALRASQDIGNQHLEVKSRYVIAMVQRQRGEISLAKQIFWDTLQLAQQIGSGTKIAELYCSLGRLTLHESDFEAAKRYLEEGLAYAQQTKQKQHLSEIYLALSELYTAIGNYRCALESYQAYHAMYLAQQKESAQNRLTAQLAAMELERAQEHAELHRLRNIELVELAVKDPLTGLYNRRYLQDYLERELKEAYHCAPLSLAVADLDNFKQVNDRFSHRIGDEVLKEIARLIQNTIRHSDIAVRFGGEEFVIVFPDLLQCEAVEVCERTRRVIAGYDWTRIHAELKMTTSIGVADTADTAQEIPEIAELRLPAERLLALADQRLYRAKEFGKNQVVWSETRNKEHV